MARAPRKPDIHAPIAGHPLAEIALEAALGGLAAVEATGLVKRAVRQGLLDDWFGDREHPRRIHVLAIGKAAPKMLWGLVEVSVPLVGLGVAPVGVQVPHVDTFTWIAGEHPVPGAKSFAAGSRVLEWVRAVPLDAPVLVLLSGGASSLVEVADGIADADLVAKSRDLLRRGLPIEEMNRRRSAMSAIKGGKLGAELLKRTAKVRVWLIADTEPGIAARTVGSAPLFQTDAPESIPHLVLAGNQEFVAATGVRLGLAGFEVFGHGRRLAGDTESEVADFVAAYRQLEKGAALVGGGEPVVRLPAVAPAGGRAHHAAVAASHEMAAQGVNGLFMALGSDGVDGSSGGSGAWAFASDWDDEAQQALVDFAASGLLRARGRSIDVGATGTNVNDLWVLLPLE